MSEGNALTRAALIVSAGILLSRLLGFLRDVVMAALLGRTLEADLYAEAFLIPDYLFFLMAGGYLTITLVPILSRHFAAGDTDEACRAFTAVFRIMAVGLIVLMGVSLLAAQPLVNTIFPQVEDPVRLADLTRIALTSQVFFGLGTLLMAAQYARRRFLIPTLAPLIYNLGIIIGGVVGALAGDPSPESFLWGGLAGAAVGNFGIQWWGARREGIRLVADAGWRHPAVREYFGLAFPLMIGQSVVALDEQWPRLFGQFVDTGATAGLAYARRLNMVPVGVIAQAAGVAAYPFLAHLFAERRLSELGATLIRSVRSAVAVSGLAVGVMVGLATPVVRLVYERGAFAASDTAFVAPLLMAYALSIPFWAAHQVYTRGFYASRRMWVPVVIGTVITGLTVPALILAVTSAGAVAVAATSSASVATYAVVVGWLWHRDQGLEPGFVGFLARVAVSSMTAGLAAWGTELAIGSTTTSEAALALITGAVVAAGVYLWMARLLGIPEVTTVVAKFIRR